MENKIHYQAAPAANVVVATGKCILKKIIVGADVASSTIEVSDSDSDGDIDVKLFLSGNTLMTSVGGEIEVNVVFNNGIAADIVNQTQVSFVWSETF